jgi:hypothetical protein
MSKLIYPIYLVSKDFESILQEDNWRSEANRNALALKEPVKHAHLFEQPINDYENMPETMQVNKLSIKIIYFFDKF